VSTQHQIDCRNKTFASPICNHFLNTYDDKTARGSLVRIAPVLQKGENPQDIKFAAEAVS
jgi:hypothetical protein